VRIATVLTFRDLVGLLSQRIGSQAGWILVPSSTARKLGRSGCRYPFWFDHFKSLNLERKTFQDDWDKTVATWLQHEWSL